jgi:hypothetical protein
VWIPRTADELEEAVRGGDLSETATVDFKEKLPPKSKNVDLAIDVSAMTPDGGVLIYGVGEDEHERPSVLRPFKLAGARERVDLISRTRSLNRPNSMSERSSVRMIHLADIWLSSFHNRRGHRIRSTCAERCATTAEEQPGIGSSRKAR